VDFKPLNTVSEEINRIQDNIEDTFNTLDNRIFAVGDIKTSFLTEQQFLRLNPKGWRFMDGKSIAGTALARILNTDVMPDFRNKFLVVPPEGGTPGTITVGDSSAAGPGDSISINLFIKVN
jgi:hypothetical protein